MRGTADHWPGYNGAGVQEEASHKDGVYRLPEAYELRSFTRGCCKKYPRSAGYTRTLENAWRR